MRNRIAHLLQDDAMTPRKRPEEPRSQLATYIPNSVHERVRDFSDASGISIARIVADALTRYLNEVYWPED